MDSTRQNKVSRLLQKELAEIFQRESRTLFNGKMITVTVVRVTPDLGLAKVYVSIFPAEKDENPIDSILEHSRKIRTELAGRVRHQLRKIPELDFYIDDSLDYADNIEKLLNN